MYKFRKSFSICLNLKLPYHNFSLRCIKYVLLGADLRAEPIDDGANLDQFVKNINAHTSQESETFCNPKRC